MTRSETVCAKCGSEPRQGTRANCWREYRATRKQTQPRKPEQADAATKATRAVMKRRGYSSERITELEAEVKRLKRLLAATHTPAESAVVARSATIGVGAAPKGQACVHDGVYGACRKLGCSAKGRA
jgi:hypothetical protein